MISLKTTLQSLLAIAFFAMPYGATAQEEILDDDIIGKWRLTKISNLQDDKLIDEIVENQKCFSYMHFKKNRKYNEVKYNSNCKKVAKHDGSYKISGKVLKTFIKGTENSLTIILFEGENLILENKFLDGIKVIKSRFHFVKHSDDEFNIFK